MEWFGDTTQAKDVNRITRPTQHPDRLDDRQPGRIVRPHPTIYKGDACGGPIRGEIGRRGGCGERYVYCALLVIDLKAWMMRGFIEMHLTGFKVERGDHQPGAALAQCFLAERRFQRTAQGLSMILGEADAAQSACKAVSCENSWSQMLVKVQDVCRRQAQPQPQGYDATGRGAGDQVKEVGNTLAQRLFELRQEGSRDNALDATAINREDSFHHNTCAGKKSSPSSSCQVWIATALSGARHAV